MKKTIKTSLMSLLKMFLTVLYNKKGKEIKLLIVLIAQSECGPVSAILDWTLAIYQSGAGDQLWIVSIVMILSGRFLFCFCFLSCLDVTMLQKWKIGHEQWRRNLEKCNWFGLIFVMSITVHFPKKTSLQGGYFKFFSFEAPV